MSSCCKLSPRCVLFIIIIIVIFLIPSFFALFGFISCLFTCKTILLSYSTYEVVLFSLFLLALFCWYRMEGVAVGAYIFLRKVVADTKASGLLTEEMDGIQLLFFFFFLEDIRVNVYSSCCNSLCLFFSFVHAFFVVSIESLFSTFSVLILSIFVSFIEHRP